jgi:hypothetical protein
LVGVSTGLHVVAALQLAAELGRRSEPLFWLERASGPGRHLHAASSCRRESVAMRERQDQNVSRSASYGLGIRVLANGAWGFAATNRVEPRGECVNPSEPFADLVATGEN